MAILMAILPVAPVYPDVPTRRLAFGLSMSIGRRSANVWPTAFRM
jgi:hypothetical protein